jgi:hypothetical protein
MKASNEILADELEDYESKLGGLNSYVNELKTMCSKCGTDKAQFEDDLMEAEQNLGFYKAQIADVKKSLAGAGAPKPTKGGPGAILPQTAKQGLGSVIFSSISFVAGALLGSKMKSRKPGKGSH